MQIVEDQRVADRVRQSVVAAFCRANELVAQKIAVGLYRQGLRSAAVPRRRHRCVFGWRRSRTARFTHMRIRHDKAGGLVRADSSPTVAALFKRAGIELPPRAIGPRPPPAPKRLLKRRYRVRKGGNLLIPIKNIHLINALK